MDNILGYVILLQLVFACCRFFASCDEQDQSSCKERAKHESPVLTQLTEPVDHAEGPHWDPERQRLLYVDISGRAIHRYNPQDNQHTSLTLNKTVSLVIPVRDSPDTFVIGYGTDLAIVTWDGQHPEHDLKVLATVDAEHPGNRFNDGKADNNGRVWAGTMGEETSAGVQPNLGSLYRWSYEKCNLEKMVTPVSISNGVAWSSDLKTMYYIDSPTRNIDKFPYNIVDGSLGKRQTVFSLDSYNIPGVPDGMTTDSNNNLWIAIWGGSRVINVEPKTGTLLRTINLPVERVTSVTFGGKYLDILFITTMRKGLNCTQLIQQPQAGAVFSVTNLGVTGTFNNPAVIPNCLH